MSHPPPHKQQLQRDHGRWIPICNRKMEEQKKRLRTAARRRKRSIFGTFESYGIWWKLDESQNFYWGFDLPPLRSKARSLGRDQESFSMRLIGDTVILNDTSSFIIIECLLDCCKFFVVLPLISWLADLPCLEELDTIRIAGSCSFFEPSLSREINAYPRDPPI